MIAIYNRPGSFSDKWIEFCENNNLPYKLIDIFSSNLIDLLRQNEITHLLFHVGTGEHQTDLCLKPLSLLLEREGIKVFPGFNEYWHYDDKVKQKYMFEQLNIPHAPMHVFYSRKEALRWIEERAEFPFVFKLSRGAGSHNVKLVESGRQGIKLINKMFGRGIKPVRSAFTDVGTKIAKHNRKNDWIKTLTRLPATLAKSLKVNAYLPPEKGYFLIQDFYQGNNYDTRVAIIGNKAFAFRRFTRPDDFRASGSGLIDYDPAGIDQEILGIAFDAAEKISGISLAFDFIYDNNQRPKIIEVSYCYAAYAIYSAGGYWTKDMKHHQQPCFPENLIIQEVINS